MYRLFTWLLLGLLAGSCRPEPSLLPQPTGVSHRSPLPVEPSETDRLTANRWVQVDERWIGFPGEVHQHPFRLFSSCATDDEYVFTTAGAFFWLSGPTECSDTTPAQAYPVSESYDRYPGRSHDYRLEADGDTLTVEAMNLRARMQFRGDTLQLTSRLTNPVQVGPMFTYVIRTQWFLPVRR